jgi:hypothetical protein
MLQSPSDKDLFTDGDVSDATPREDESLLNMAAAFKTIIEVETFH